MKTLAQLHEMSRDELCASIREMSRCIKKLDELKRNTDRPDDLVAKFINSVGREKAEIVIASLINVNAWDGRICPPCRNWAASVPESWDEEAMREYCLNTTMHMAHLDQTGWFARKIREGV